MEAVVPLEHLAADGALLRRGDDRRDGLRGRIDGGPRAPVGRVAAAALLVIIRIGRVLEEGSLLDVFTYPSIKPPWYSVRIEGYTLL